MKSSSQILICLALLNGGCAQAVFFHESTKVAIAAEYKPDPSEPVSANFGLKRRIVAVVPVQDPDLVTRQENKGEALSLVSRFEIRGKLRNAGDEPLTIINNFASGTAARLLTAKPSEPVKTTTATGTKSIIPSGDPESKVDALLNTELGVEKATGAAKAKGERRKRVSRISNLLQSELPITD